MSLNELDLQYDDDNSAPTGGGPSGEGTGRPKRRSYENDPEYQELLGK